MAKQEINTTFKAQTKAMLLCYIVFVLFYMGAKHIALARDISFSIVLPLDLYVPFLPWMILPYALSGPLFCLVFYWTNTEKDLKILTKRMLMVTLSAFVCFVVFPIGYSAEKPAVENPFLKIGFDFIATWDSKYNQAPSLHVAYGVLFLSVVITRFKGVVKWLLGCSIILLCISTLFVYQHHSIDLFSAILLCLIVFYVTTDKSNPLYRNKRIALVYFGFATMLVLIASLSWTWFGLLLIWIAFNMCYVGYNYSITNPYFIKNKRGNVSLVKRILFQPYLLTYVLLRKFNQMYKPVIPFELMPQFFVGGYLNPKQAKTLFKDKNTIVIDVSAELIENRYFKKQCTYYFMPSLDIAATMEDEINVIINRITTLYLHKPTHAKVYLHCAMGYSRSMYLAKYVLMRSTNIAEIQAIATIKQLNKNAIFRNKTN